jgi:hypothetical protein
MRTNREFVQQYRAALGRIDPATNDFDRGEIGELALTELSLRFVSKFSPEQKTDVVPFLVSGYPAVVAAGRSPDALLALSVLRHLASRFGSVSTWADACRLYRSRLETIRCFDIVDGRAQLRRACPDRLLAVLDAQLSSPVPWTKDKKNPAPPGQGIVSISGGEVLLAYNIPALPDTAPEVRQHELNRRSENPPISFTQSELEGVAAQVDARETAKDWPRQILAPLELSKRLKGVRIIAPGTGGEARRLVLNGATHVVGMLSSGKSTIAMAVLFATTLRVHRRVAVIAPDTLSGSLLAERLKLHGISAAVLASFRRRERHLVALKRDAASAAGGASLTGVASTVHGFSSACPLDGFQEDHFDVLRGTQARARWPLFAEKPCGRILMRPTTAALTEHGAPMSRSFEREDDEQEDDYGPFLCPLFPVCPAHEQERASPQAQVLIMTPAAFAYVAPEPWVLRERMPIAELLQFAVDLVIIDEVDSVQKDLDRRFAPDEPIMDGLPGAYVTEVAGKSAEAMRLRSGGQFRRRAAVIWHNKFHSLSRLVVLAYGVLQNERELLAGIFRNGPFTATQILCDLHSQRRRRMDVPEDPEALIAVMRAISTISRVAPLSDSDVEPKDSATQPADDAHSEIGAAANALRDVARQVLVADDYAPVAAQIEKLLEGPLALFDSRPAERYATAQKILLAVISELILSYYSWLTLAQPAVEREFGIEQVGSAEKAPLVRNYRTLLPSNPARTVLGLRWDEPDSEVSSERGGRLRILSHLGVGRHLVVHLHDLLSAEGQAGPHVLMLSGTSWAGGPRHRSDLPDHASPSFDVQTPVAYVLRQPDEEIEAIKMSRFELVEARASNGHQVHLSGAAPAKRPELLRTAAECLARVSEGQSPGENLIESHWDESERLWGRERFLDRRRALLVVNSYADAVTTSNALARSLRRDPRTQHWHVFCLRRDGEEEDESEARGERLDTEVAGLARSRVESFGREVEHSILVAPIQVVSRGHNILNASGKAAISSIYFLHRPHPRPDDLSPLIGRLNRLAIEAFNSCDSEARQSIADFAVNLRRSAMTILRESLGRAQKYSTLSAEYKAQFAWDLLTQLWQAIGRGLRGGAPVFVGFVDAAFAERSFEARADTPENSALMQALRQLELAMGHPDPRSRQIAARLYGPFFDALKRTRNLYHECNAIA